MKREIIEDVRSQISKWIDFAERDFRIPPERPDLGYYGTGYDAWGVQTNQKYAACLALTVLDPVLNALECRLDTDVRLDRALRALRYSFASHKTGDFHASDGIKWGCTWISSLGIERMMHAVDLLDTVLTDTDRASLRRMLVAEADFQLTATVLADRFGDSGKNKPESNIWNGAILARTALMYPDEKHAADWLEKASVFLVNGISIPSDAECREIVDGKPVQDRYIGANFFPNFSLDHHNYLNVGYMVICISNIAMLHYGLKRRGLEPPQALYRHVGELWALIRRLIFRNGRLIRIGGDSRVRYSYCQDYLLPSLVFAADYLKDPAAIGLLAECVKLDRIDQDAGPDGGYLSRRLGTLVTEGPYYYTRVEADKAYTLTLAAHWLEWVADAPPVTPDEAELELAGGWCEPEHGAVFHRSPTRFASFAWKATWDERVQGLALPPQDGHLAEWRGNLGGSIVPLSAKSSRIVENFEIASFDGGFLTWGTYCPDPEIHLLESYSVKSRALMHRLVFAALPDGHSVIRIEYATLAEKRIFLRRIAGVFLEVPNDIFNDSRRTIVHENGETTLSAHLGPKEIVDTKSAWISIDGKTGALGVYGADGWKILRKGYRAGSHQPEAGSILTETFCYGLEDGALDYTGPTTLLDNGSVIVSSVDCDGVARLHRERSGRDVRPSACAAPVRAIRFAALDGRAYLLAANFSGGPVEVKIDADGGKWSDLVTGDCVEPARLQIVSGGARLLRLG